MPKKLTQKEVKRRCLEKGFKLLETYVNSKIHTLVECRCGQEFRTQITSILSGSVKTCGHCNDPQIGDIFGRLSITKVIPGRVCGCLVEAKCICGTAWKGIAFRLISGHTKSCGHCNDPKIGDKFGTLTVTKVIPDKSGGSSVEAKCICGVIWSGCTANLKQLQSCGQCQLKRNGITTSYKSLELHGMLKHKGVHNHKTLFSSTNRSSYTCIDIAYILNTNKIAIEYDEWYWHSQKIEEDKKRLAKLRRNGWKTLHIKASSNLPTQKQLDDAIYKLAYTNSKSVTITLPRWGKGPTRFTPNTKETIKDGQ